MGVADADRVVATQVHVRLVAGRRPPEPEYRHPGVHDMRIGCAEPVVVAAALPPFVFQHSHQPLKPLDAAHPVMVVHRRAAGQQAKVCVAHVAAETVHRRPDHVQAAVGRAALDQRGQRTPHGHLRLVNALGLPAVHVPVPHGPRQLQGAARNVPEIIILRTFGYNKRRRQSARVKRSKGLSIEHFGEKLFRKLDRFIPTIPPPPTVDIKTIQIEADKRIVSVDHRRSIEKSSLKLVNHREKKPKTIQILYVHIV